MKASTHTEVYRPFTGELRRRPRRALVLARSALRVGFKRKLPLLLLFTVPAVVCIIMSFMVYFGFSRGGAIQAVMGSTVERIFGFVRIGPQFVLILMAWYGSGLISEDKRLGANLLYFSRPVSRFDYILGKFMAASFYGVLALIVPCLLICLTAVFASPEWSFLKEEWEVIPKVIAFGGLWVATIALVVLTVSSLTDRRTHALIGAIGVIWGTSIVSKLLVSILRDERATILNLFSNMERIGEWMFGLTLVRDRAVSLDASLAALAALWVICLFFLTERVRRLEVVA